MDGRAGAAAKRSSGYAMRSQDSRAVAGLLWAAWGVVATIALGAYVTDGRFAASTPPVRRLNTSSCIDLNRSDWPQLCLLPGISETLARRIVDERTQRGPFQDVEALARVKGIGPKTIAALAPFICAAQAGTRANVAPVSPAVEAATSGGAAR